MVSNIAVRFFALLTAATLVASIPSREAPANNLPIQPVQLTADLIRTGLRLLPYIMPDVNAHLRIAINVPMLSEFSIDLATDDGRRAEIEERLKVEQNQILREQLQAMRDLLDVQKRRNEILAEHNRHLVRIGDIQAQLFDYMKARDEGLMRKERYAVGDKLVVVVSDFSSGIPDQGREIADEIARHLEELKKHGIDIEVIVGEMKPGITIRSDAMARDLGRHFPADTDIVVIWGTMSPRTVGRYRPHLTCVKKLGDSRGVSTSFAVELAPEKLPLAKDGEEAQRECYERLIGVTCAAIPNCFAAHEIGRDRTPNLEQFYRFLGDTPEAKQFKSELEPFTRWTSAINPEHQHLRRISEIKRTVPYPFRIVNDQDNSVMVLITDEKGQPRRFPSTTPGKEEIVYIDVLETTTSQYVKFLNANRGNKEEGGTRWVKIDSDFADMEEKDDRFIAKEKWKQRAVINVSWFGAAAYCRWAKKKLPRPEEWQLAAASKGEGRYPWGDGFEKEVPPCNCAQSGWTNYEGGAFPKDLSRVGCYDMAGNVAEWCDTWHNESKAERPVLGGSFNDADPKYFQVGFVRGEPQTNYQRWIGFRGVVRLQVNKEER